MRTLKLKDIENNPGWNGVAEYRNVNDAYDALLVGILKNGLESAPRGLKVRDGQHISIKILEPWDNIVYSRNRMLPPRYLAGEWEWYKSGSNKVEDISKFSKFWLNITNEDGTVNSNYGYYAFSNEYWQKHIKMAEILNPTLESGRKIKMSDYNCWWDYAKAQLEDDNDNRQVVIQIPTGFTESTKDTCCTPFVQFFIRRGRLDMDVNMRSNDIVKGFANDVFQFTMWQARMAKELGIPMGIYYHSATTLHIYEPDFKDLDSDIDYAYFDDDYYNIPEDYLTSEDFEADLLHLINKEYNEVKDERLKLLIQYQAEKREQKVLENK